jgi:predicted phosphohydrolase
MTSPAESAEPTTVRIWALGDPHLSFARPKPMDIFGSQWTNHAEKIARNAARLVEPQDILLIPGDISWALKRPEARVDLTFLAEQLPGVKILIKGNHDYWWDSDKPLNFPGLYDTPYISADGVIGVAGTRGWDMPAEGSTIAERNLHQKHVDREVRRLSKRLDAITSAQRKFVMIHYPPLPDFAPLLRQHQVEAVVYGHVHLGGKGWMPPEDWNGIRCLCVAADRIGFTPRLIASMKTL